MFRSIPLRPAALVVSAILIALTFFLGRRPYYNWDMFPYMAVIMARPGLPFDTVHRAVYKAAAEYLPPHDFQAITARQPELAGDPKAFEAILRYFTIKPGYTMLAKLFYRIGVHPVLATCLPSLLGYLVVGIVLFAWSQSVANPVSASLFTLLVALSPPMIDLARYSSPDMMCAALSVGAIPLILTARPLAGLGLLYLAVWVRPDAILLLAPIAFAMAFAGTIRWSMGGAFVLLGSGTAFLIIGGTELIREYVQVDPSLNQWSSWIQGLQSPSIFLIIFLALGAGLLYLSRLVNLPPSRSFLIWAGLVSLVTRYMLHPVFEDRFNLPAYFLILMIGWETIANLRNRLVFPNP